MEKELAKFEEIAEHLSKEYKSVSIGKMMSSDGIRYKTKFFVFYYNDDMVFRLGKDAKPEKLGVKKFKLLNPFKTKAPLKNWFVVPYSESKHWEKLAIFAMNVLIAETKSK